MVSSSNACCNCTEMENSRENSAAAYLDMASSVLFLDDFQIQDDVLARVETGHRAGCRLCIVLFRVQFVIRVGVESAEPVTSGVIGIAASHGVGPHVLQENNATGERVVGFVAYHAANGAQLRFTLLVLSVRSGRERGDDHQHAKEASSNLHFWSPFSGCIRKTTVCSLPPPFASIVRVAVFFLARATGFGSGILSRSAGTGCGRFLCRRKRHGGRKQQQAHTHKMQLSRAVHFAGYPS